MLNGYQSKAGILDRVIQEIATILDEKSLSAEGVVDTTPFSEFSLTSLDLAGLVSSLEAHYGVDPFEEMVAITSIVTVGDLASAYSNCLSGIAGDDSLSEELKEIREKSN